MDVLVFVAILAALVWLWWVFGFRPTDATMRGLGRVLGFSRADDWPRGVQEEDPDRPWGAGRSRTPLVKRPPAIPEPERPVVVVGPVVRRP